MSDPNAVFDHDENKPRLLAEQCTTCVFRPGNLMHLAPGRLAELIAHNRQVGAGLTCHQTLPSAQGDAEPAWCRGFHDAYPETTAVRFAHTVFGSCHEVPPPKQSPEQRGALWPESTTRVRDLCTYLYRVWRSNR